MSNLDNLITTLALIYEDKQAVDRAYESAMQDFKLKNAEVIRRREKLNEQVDKFREEILEEALQTDELPSQIQIQWRDTPIIYEPSDLYSWAIDNMIQELLKVDEKAVKEYVKENGGIVDSNGIVLAGMQKKPVLIAGENILLAWLEEIRFNQNHSEE